MVVESSSVEKYDGACFSSLDGGDHDDGYPA